MKKNNKTGSDRTARIVRLIIAACLAVFLWMYINGNDINMITQEINNIPVTLINTEKLSSKGLVLTEQKNYFVNIRVRGSERNVNTLDASQITATVDLAGVKGPGTYTADVVIQGLPNSVILQETQPSELNIKIDSIRHKAHSVTINTSGKPGNNLSVVSATTTDLVRVEGPSDSVNKIKACVATANVQDMTDDTDVYIPVKAVDKKGNVLSDVECKPSMIKASVKIGTTKRVKIKAPKTTGSVADGYKVAKITVSPKTVLLGGKASDLDSINAVRPSTVDLSGLKISTTVQKKLNLPSNVTNMDYMFYKCRSLTNLDLSSFNTENVTNMSEMFYNNRSLKTISVSNLWDTSNVSSGSNMFASCYNLKGGAGTVYDSNNTELSYAHVDGGPSNPRYLTYKTPTAIKNIDAETNATAKWYTLDGKRLYGKPVTKGVYIVEMSNGKTKKVMVK